MVLPRPDLPAAGQARAGGLGAHPGRAARPRLREGHRDLSAGGVVQPAQGRRQVRGGEERGLRVRAVPPGGLDLPRLADPVLPDRRDPEREGSGRQRRVLLRPGGRGRRELDRHDRDQGARPLGVQPGRAAAQREEVRSGGGGARAVPQVGSERTSRPSVVWPRRTAIRARSSRPRRWRRRSSRPVGPSPARLVARAAAAAPGRRT